MWTVNHVVVAGPSRKPSYIHAEPSTLYTRYHELTLIPPKLLIDGHSSVAVPYYCCCVGRLGGGVYSLAACRAWP